ncbi:MAG: hypothetical protein EHM24_12240 [Acidobacteria bacterium]|nr:MAG: hypothetical protein EHM24_12240 [Acidobacteriota bacterium]
MRDRLVVVLPAAAISPASDSGAMRRTSAIVFGEKIGVSSALSLTMRATSARERSASARSITDSA